MSSVLLGCGVMEAELTHGLANHPRIELECLPPALHADIGKLETVLADALYTLRSHGVREIFVAFGTQCSPSTTSILVEYGDVYPSTGNCLEPVAGQLCMKAEKEGGLVLTPGCIRAWPEIMNALGWESADVRMNLGRYNAAVVFDPKVEPLGARGSALVF